MKTKCDTSAVWVVMLVVGLAGGAASAKLVAHWEFDETSGTTVKDSSGNGHHGTVIEGTPKWYSDGKYGGCLNFDGTYGVSIPSAVFSSADKAITVSVWVNGDAQEPNDTKVILQAGAGDGPDHHFVLSIYTAWQAGVVQIATGYPNADSEAWREASLEDWAGKWNHYAFVVDSVKGLQRIYHNGRLAEGGTSRKPMGGVTKANIGIGTDRAHRQYFGKLDDIRIYDRALSEAIIGKLYGFNPVPQTLTGVLERAQAFMEKQQVKTAIPLLEQSIGELEQYIERKPNKYVSCFRELSFDLNFLLAKAKDVAGFPEKDVEAAYKLALEQGTPSSSNCACVLLWLHEKGNRQMYDSVTGSLDENNKDYLKEVAAKAKMMVREQKTNSAIRFLEDTLAAYTGWRQEHPDSGAATEDGMIAAYAQLAKAREAAGASKKDITDAYNKVFSRWCHKYVPAQTEALIWWLENECSDDYAAVIESLRGSPAAERPSRNIVERVCKYFESKKDWSTFERFLDALFAEVEYPSRWPVVVESCLGNNANRWGRKYFAYLASRPRVKFCRDCMVAETNLSDGNFEKAAELYKDILNRCDSKDDRALFKFQLCKCVFYGGGYAEARKNIESFVADNKGTHTSLVKDAILMESLAYIQIGEPEKALESLSSLKEEYPETQDLPGVNFLAGYCYMLQSKYEAAREGFDRVIRSAPSSLYASKARMCRTRVENMAALKSQQ